MIMCGLSLATTGCHWCGWCGVAEWFGLTDNAGDIQKQQLDMTTTEAFILILFDHMSRTGEDFPQQPQRGYE